MKRIGSQGTVESGNQVLPAAEISSLDAPPSTRTFHSNVHVARVFAEEFGGPMYPCATTATNEHHL